MPSNFWSGLCRRTTRVLNFPSGGFSSTVITLQIQSGRRPAKNVVMAENQALETKPLHDMRPCPSRDRKERYPQEPSHEAPQQHAASRCIWWRRKAHVLGPISSTSAELWPLRATHPFESVASSSSIESFASAHRGHSNVLAVAFM